MYEIIGTPELPTPPKSCCQRNHLNFARRFLDNATILSKFFARIFLAMPKLLNAPHNAPIKSRVRGAANFLDWKGILYHYTDLFAYNGVSKTRG